MSELTKELGVEVQKHITNLNNMAMLNISGKTFEELAIMRVESQAAYARLREAEKRLAKAVEFEAQQE